MDQITHVLDTHVVVWAMEDSPRLRPLARQVIREAQWGELAISGMTLLELAMLIQRGRIDLTCSLREALNQVAEEFIVFPIDEAVAATSVMLAPFHGDPFDRTIVATAKAHDLPLLTADRNISRSGLVEVLW